ncbi:MAG: AbrB/MazE/SpoVT family DNA-binding domain-containing protein [Candidatus Hadarchaeota archaeon]|nr:AbrB/MazE/SpoVT family DNA-binding domain-containing protein [Candidatus Hadarchaeota archaeon]
MVSETWVSEGGRVVIPKGIREMFGLEVGEEVLVDVEGRKIVIKPKKRMKDPVKRLYGSIKVKPEASPKKVARK